jgi:hypothetical protein
MLIITGSYRDSNFPLNDDWSYAQSVWSLVKNGKLEFTCYNCSTNLLQILYGAITSKIFGFSFVALRITSWIFGLMGVIFMYLLIRRVSVSPRLALVAALTLSTNVIYFNLANTYMTDVPFFALLTASAYYSVVTLQDGHRFNYIMAIVCILAATFVRQFGIVFLLCFLLIYTCKKRFKPKAIASSIIVIATVSILLWFFRQLLLSTADGLPEAYSIWTDYFQYLATKGPLFTIQHMAYRIFVQIIYLGLFILPFSLITLGSFLFMRTQKERIIILVAISDLLILLLFIFNFAHLPMPLSTNIIFNSGVGPLLLTVVHGIHGPASLGESFWTIVKVLSCLGVSISAGMLITEKFLHKNQQIEETIESKKYIRLLFLIFFFAYISVTSFILLDRYILPAFLPLCVLMATLLKMPKTSHKNTGYLFQFLQLSSFILLILCGYFCIVTTHDYFAFNRARWQALNHATNALKISPSVIDGGFEFNGWMAYRPKLRQGPVKCTDIITNDGKKYMVAFGPVPGYPILGCWAYKRWLPPYTNSIYLLEKTDLAPAKQAK